MHTLAFVAKYPCLIILLCIGILGCQASEQADWSVSVNGAVAKVQADKGFISIARKWQAGDQVELMLSMPVRFNEAMDSVAADRDKLAVSRGPLVYAAEGIDNQSPLDSFHLLTVPDSEDISMMKTKGVLFGIPLISLPAQHGDEKDRLVKLPYYAWNNRGESSMKVWIDEKAKGRQSGK